MGTIGTRTKLSDRGIFHGCRCPVYHHFVDDTLFHLYVRYDMIYLLDRMIYAMTTPHPSNNNNKKKGKKKKNENLVMIDPDQKNLHPLIFVVCFMQIPEAHTGDDVDEHPGPEE